MDLQLKGRTAVVTGSSQGLGRAIAVGLSLEGVKVAAVARRMNLLEQLAAEIVAAGGDKPVLVQADLYPDDAAERIAGDALKALGRVDILVNAAGGSRPLPLEGTREQWLEGMTLNFFRLRELTHALMPGMQQHGYGRVINLTGTREPRNLNAAHGFSAVSDDFNQDGKIDIFVANDSDPNFLFLNQGNGTFKEAALAPGPGGQSDVEAPPSSAIEAVN